MAKKQECPHCGGWFAPHSLARHKPVCEVKPSDEELLSMRLDHMSAEAIADEVGVSHATVRVWLRACGADKIGVRSRWASAPTVYPAKTLRYGQEGGCERCGDWALCDELQQAGRRVRCEAPDDNDLRAEQDRRNGKPLPAPTCSVSAWETIFTIGRG